MPKLWAAAEQCTIARLISGRAVRISKTVDSALVSSTEYRKLNVQKMGPVVSGIRAVG